MGALTIASVSTFTSCKDYDDDINNLQSQIDALSKTLSELQTKINDGSILKSVESDGNGGIIVTVTKNGKDTSYNIKQGVQGAAGKDGDVWKIGENGYWYKNDTKTEYYALGIKGDKGDKGDQGDKGEAGTAGKDGKYYVPNPDTGTFWVYGDGDKAAYDSKIVYTATNADVITAVWDNDNLTLTNVAGAPGKKVVVSLSSALKSLVFDPDFYYAGIEAFDFATYKYNPATVKAVDADGDYSKDAPTVAGDAFTYAPDLAATYFLNPSNAKMSNDAAKYSFIAYNKDYVSRAAADYGSTFKVESADLTTKGKVTVHAKYNGNAIKDLANGDKVTVLALQYTSGDSVVTSDFAAIKASTYDKLVLNNPTLQHVDAIPSHLYQTAKAAIDNNAQIHVAWNSKGIDLREYVNTDRTYEDGTPTCKAWDKNAAEGLVEKSGFKYSFELVGYKSGANETSQSAHAAIASNGYTLRPQMTAGGKQQAYGAAQNEATIGREPLVRVILKDTVNNKIAAVGYIKVVIDKTNKAEEVDLVTVNKPYTIACGDNNIDLQKVTWAQVEEQLYAKLNMSKEAFEDAYELDGGTADANQFEKATTDAEALAADKKIGTVSQTTADIEGKMTEVIAWSIKNQAAYAAFKAGKTTLSTYVRYALKAGKTAANKYVYVKLTWTPSAINLKPSATFGNENKIKNYWYAANNAVAGTGYDDVHGNVEVVGTEGANDQYVFDLKIVLVGNKLSVNPLTAPYADLNQELKLTFGFVTGKGLFASEDGTKVYAEKELTNVVASLDPVSGKVTYANNETAKKLLNAYGHKDLKNTVTAIVAVKATICGNIDVPVASNEFNVKFLRPINVEKATASFEDAETAGSTAKINLTFTDWRDHNFTDTNVTKGQDYFKYYGVKKIAVDIDNATTDLNGNSSEKLLDLTDKVKFTFSAPATISADEYGELKYENNGLTVGQFHVYFPATITYDWGTIKTTITATVGKTQNNAHRH